jgi:hypothetical protein
MITLLTAAEASGSACAFLAAVSVAPEVFELRPDYCVLVLAAEGLEPGPPNQASDEMLSRAGALARTALGGRAPEEVPRVADWRAARRPRTRRPDRSGERPHQLPYPAEPAGRHRQPAHHRRPAPRQQENTRMLIHTCLPCGAKLVIMPRA